jgi:hypothetical protein
LLAPEVSYSSFFYLLIKTNAYCIRISDNCYSLARTISTGSSVSAIAFPCRGSVEHLVKDNPAFTEDPEDVPPNYSEVEAEMNEEVGCN